MTTKNNPIVIFDIDGTLADNGHRQYLLANGEYKWETFFQAMGEDKPIEPIVNLCKDLHSLKKYQIHLFTGRPERYRKLTEQWLTWNNIPPLPLHMRQDGDVRQDEIIKEEMLDNILLTDSHVSFVVDDRDSVVAMWRRRGIVCLQCLSQIS